MILKITLSACNSGLVVSTFVILQVKAYDRGGLSSECPLTVYVKEESRHSPVIEPLMITLNTLMGEFLGGKIGKVHARDDVGVFACSIPSSCCFIY